jgi:excinuclease ABC subunit C
VLQQARDEAHRFAITFQRKRRSMRTMTSELLRIPGVGESKRRQLLAAFGSLQGVRAATPAAIAGLPGFGQKIAERILEVLRGTAPDAPHNTATIAEPVAANTPSDPT